MSIYMPVDGIVGSATNNQNKGWLEVLTFGWKTQRNIKHKVGVLSNRESSSVKMSELVLVRPVDKATPQLFKASFSSQARTIHIHLTRTGFKDGLTPYRLMSLKTP